MYIPMYLGLDLGSSKTSEMLGIRIYIFMYIGFVNCMYVLYFSRLSLGGGALLSAPPLSPHTTAKSHASLSRGSKFNCQPMGVLIAVTRHAIPNHAEPFNGIEARYVCTYSM